MYYTMGALQWRHTSATSSQINQLFPQPFAWANSKENIKTSHNWPFARVDSPHEGSIMRKAFPWHDVNMYALYRIWANIIDNLLYSTCAHPNCCYQQTRDPHEKNRSINWSAWQLKHIATWMPDALQMKITNEFFWTVIIISWWEIQFSRISVLYDPTDNKSAFAQVTKVNGLVLSHDSRNDDPLYRIMIS